MGYNIKSQAKHTPLDIPQVVPGGRRRNYTLLTGHTRYEPYILIK
jgi:hypothetical protein